MSALKKFKRTSAIILCIAIVSLMTACSPKYVKPQLPSNLRHCDPMTELSDNTMGSMAIWILEHSEKYKDCNYKSEAKNVFFADGE